MKENEDLMAVLQKMQTQVDEVHQAVFKRELPTQSKRVERNGWKSDLAKRIADERTQLIINASR
jgi:hypothetical protein